MIARILACLRDRRGATAVEYGFVCALIVVVMIGAFRGVADETIGLWTDVADNVTRH